MKYIKKYELNFNQLDYIVGDIVVSLCDVKRNNEYTLKKGKKYKVIKIYKIIEDMFLNNSNIFRIDVEDIETGDVTFGWSSDKFKSIIEFNANKYNL